MDHCETATKLVSLKNAEGAGDWRVRDGGRIEELKNIKTMQNTQSAIFDALIF